MTSKKLKVPLGIRRKNPMKWVLSISRDYWGWPDVTLQCFEIWEFWGIKTFYRSKFSPATGVTRAKKIGDSPIKSEVKLGRTWVLSEGTIELVPKSWKMAIPVPRRRGGTWEEVPVATWCSEWICRMRGGLVHHKSLFLQRSVFQFINIIPSPTTFQYYWSCTRIAIFFQSPIF